MWSRTSPHSGTQCSPLAAAHATSEFHVAECLLAILTAAPFPLAFDLDSLVGATRLGEIDVVKRPCLHADIDRGVEVDVRPDRNVRAAGGDVEIVRLGHGGNQCGQKKRSSGADERFSGHGPQPF